MNTSPKAGVHSLLSPDPRLRGTSSWEYGCAFPAGLRQDLLSFLPRGHRPLRRRKVRSIPDAQVWASVMPLPCASSPHQTRFAGLWRGPRLSICAVQTQPTLAEPWQLVRPATAAPNRKAGTRRCHLEVQCQQIWMEAGTSGPRVGGEQILILPAGNNCRTEVPRFRRRGPGTSRL